MKTTKLMLDPTKQAVTDKHRISLLLEELEQKNGVIAELKARIAALEASKPKPARKPNAKTSSKPDGLSVNSLITVSRQSDPA